MLEKITIARPYAQAAFDYAREEGDVAAWSAMLKLLSAIVSNPQMRPLLHNPNVSDGQLHELIAGIAGDKLADHGDNFVRILIDAERLQVVPEISELYEAMLAKAEGRVEVHVVSAYDVEDRQEETISAAMAKRLGKKITVISRVNDQLIGGAIIRAGDSVIDASIRGRLTQLRNELI